MQSRRRFLQQGTLATVAASTSLSFVLNAQQTMHTLWGPPVGVSVLLAVAVAQGRAAKHHKTQAKIWRNPDQLRVGVANGSMPLTVVPSYVAANLYNQGQSVKLFNIMTWGLLNIVARDKSVQSLQDLKGKHLVMPFKNDMPDLVLQILCKKIGLTLQNDFKVTYTATPPEAVAMIIAGRADCAMLPEPAASVAVLKGKKMGQAIHSAIDIQQAWGEILGGKPRIPQAGLMIEQNYYQQNKEFITLLQADLAEAVTWVANNPRTAAELGSDYLSIPAPILESALSRSKLAATPVAEVSHEVSDFYQKLFDLNPKIIGGKIPDKAFWSL